jgi:HAD superfamily hydrolase (TIGR01509 family)
MNLGAPVATQTGSWRGKGEVSHNRLNMTRIECLFIDNGGVLTDNAQRSVHYRRLVGAYFAPRYGGARVDWEGANANSASPAWQRFVARLSDWDDSKDVVRAMWQYHADWLRLLFAAKGLTPPVDDDACAALGHAAERWINPQIITLFPGVEDVIVSLSSRFRLFTASDGFSASLAETLAPITASFERLYGPDLVNIPKSAGRRYYEAIFRHAGVDPSRALVLDDNLPNVLAATEAGAQAVLVGNQPDPSYEGLRIDALDALPNIIETL